MNRTWKTKTASILMIVGGFLGVIFGIIVAAIGIPVGAVVAEILPVFGVFLEGIGPGLIALGVVAIVGGIVTRRRNKWGLALGGAICSLFPIVPLGVAAIIFASLGKKEYA
ncbi:MAG: hypothetical protein IMY81_00415 [Chloroflexi bacterium]|nr:hypothetical protein [Chloroflexota bacterium]